MRILRKSGKHWDAEYIVSQFFLLYIKQEISESNLYKGFKINIPHFDYGLKARETAAEIVESRGLTSCMNNTKWQEFRVAMEDEVKVRPRYYEYIGGRLAGKKIMHDAESEFIEILNKYTIPYEAANGTYIIYGYK